jgi:hypothetical protein
MVCGAGDASLEGDMDGESTDKRSTDGRGDPLAGLFNDVRDSFREWLLAVEPGIHDPKYDRTPPLDSLPSTVPVSWVENESILSASSSSLPL